MGSTLVADCGPTVPGMPLLNTIGPAAVHKTDSRSYMRWAAGFYDRRRDVSSFMREVWSVPGPGVSPYQVVPVLLRGCSVKNWHESSSDDSLHHVVGTRGVPSTSRRHDCDTHDIEVTGQQDEAIANAEESVALEPAPHASTTTNRHRHRNTNQHGCPMSPLDQSGTSWAIDTHLVSNPPRIARKVHNCSCRCVLSRGGGGG